ncbi:MFS transporter [Microbispora hainanensis]|uniref:MFS transporter n=1 Tax=Microbispora hainanensis TaxID=568844 RepID=A0A544Z042_9ACTN|nr:MFS transporter [Microbispora hainanensis]TQS22413.1 MFS transporter [Microbispora hainanensis]
MDLRELRRARFAVSVAFALHGAVTGGFASRIPWIQDHVGVGPGGLGLALLSPAVGSILAMSTAGRLTHRFGVRAVTRLAIGLWCLLLALPPLAPDLPLLCAALLLFGAVAGVADVAMNAQGVEVEQRLGRSIMSGLHGMWSVGTLVGGGVGTLAASAGLDARLHLSGMAVVLFLVGLAAGPLLLDLRAGEDEPAPPPFMLPPRGVLVIGLVGFCAVFAEGAAQDWCAVYLRQVAGASQAVGAAAYTAFACMMAAGRLCGDAVVRRLGPVATLRGSGALAALGGLLVVVSRTPVPAVAGFMLIGVGIAVVVPLVFAAAGNAGSSPSEGVAGAATVSYASGFVAPSAIGGIAQLTGLPASFALVTVLLLAVLLGAGRLAPPAQEAVQAA